MGQSSAILLAIAQVMFLQRFSVYDCEKPENRISFENKGLFVSEKTLACYKRDVSLVKTNKQIFFFVFYSNGSLISVE